MTHPEDQNDDLARRLEWATSSQPPADLDAEASQWREAWQGMGNRLESEAPPFDAGAFLAKMRAELESGPALVFPASASDPTPRSAWWVAMAVVLVAMLSGGWWVVRQIYVTSDVSPIDAPLVGPEKVEPNLKNPTPEEKPSPEKVVEDSKPKPMQPEVKPSAEELALTAWDDAEVDTALTEVKTQVYSAGSDWHQYGNNLLDERLQDLEEQMDEDGSL